MDPASAIGVASGILAFITVSIKVVKAGREVYHSIGDGGQENISRETIITEMTEFMNTLPAAGDRQLVREDQSLAELVGECRKIAEELLKMLQKMKAKDDKSTFSKLRAAIRQVSSQSELEGLEKRLDYCRGQLELHLNAKYFHQTKHILADLLSHTHANTSKLTELQTGFDQLKGVVVGSPSEDANEKLRQLLGIHQEALNMFYQDQILQSLRFPDMHGRYEMLHPADESTFRWILEDNPNTSNHDVPPEYDEMRHQSREKLANWLSSSEGLFHISGKLGSGKSTLMKYLYQNHRTKSALENWAGSKRLVLANFFFWKPGSPLQKSLAGLCRSILHSLLQSCPEFIPSALPEHWEKIKRLPLFARHDLEVSADQVQTALQKFIEDKRVYAENRCCLFIDGLDEYDQTPHCDHTAMVSLLHAWVATSHGNLKVCTSSREDNVFMNAFTEDCRLRIHELTLYDMRGYVQDKLCGLPSSEAKEDLIVDISDNANGIFFWVALVVQAMRESIENGGDVNDLKDLLNSLPIGLEELFHHILTKLGEQKRIKAHETIIMLSALKAGNYPPLSLLAYSFYNDYKKDQRFAFRDDLVAGKHIDETLLKTRIELARKQLRANCGGLLESGLTLDVLEGGASIEYTHRSVPEYLERLRVQESAAAVSHKFDAIDAASSLLVAHIRLVDCFDPEAATRTCAGLAYLRITNRVDEEPFEFLEFLDSRVDESCWRRMEQAEEINFYLSATTFQCIHHRFHSGTRPAQIKCVEVYCPLWHALQLGFDAYVTWKLGKQAANSPFKRMLLAHVVLFQPESVAVPPWDCLFDNGVFSDTVVQYYFESPILSIDDYPGDLERLTEMTALHQFLINCFFLWCEFGQSTGLDSKREADWFGQVVEQFLNRDTSTIDFEASVKTKKNAWEQALIAEFTFKLQRGSRVVVGDAKAGIVDGISIKCPSWLFDIVKGRDDNLTCDREMHMSFRQFIEVVMPDNMDRLLSLLERNVSRLEPTIDDEVELGPLQNASEKENGPSKVTPSLFSEDETCMDIEASSAYWTAWCSKHADLIVAFALGE
ncbi:P-loop containing nucleoside triphosphate hydrolase [Pochonia chlamydosporia 170]|uniref:P-loop containing nucleoside triphosphate hydrolase n=1 Tax=Pochonia chlamydosporia 170 TaxID=1380566 RepID=A0A179FHI3_METCM|nr:P-loop containing nucleoside triphosphate hydrolase [Pochonia chlamydosporia 170]OAQ64867.1 P-loop containing nucleoside triphosphate hydrolase [Pochonia chlamydosporia 170]